MTVTSRPYEGQQYMSKNCYCFICPHTVYYPEIIHMKERLLMKKKLTALLLAMVMVFAVAMPIAVQACDDQGCDYDEARPPVTEVMPINFPFEPEDG